MSLTSFGPRSPVPSSIRRARLPLPLPCRYVYKIISWTDQNRRTNRPHILPASARPQRPSREYMYTDLQSLRNTDLHKTHIRPRSSSPKCSVDMSHKRVIHLQRDQFICCVSQRWWDASYTSIVLRVETIRIPS